MDELKRTDPEIFDLIKAEEHYEIDSVRLIASENYVSKAVLEATGSILTNKYSEGYPGRRYYEGQRNIDQIETIAVDRGCFACMLGGADGRTLFVATAPDSDPEKCRATRGGRIETTQVEVPRAGLP